MKKIVAAVLTCVSLSCSATPSARHAWVDELFEQGRPIKAAVDQFNQKHEQQRVECGQPPLTKDELIAALRIGLRRDATRLNDARRKSIQRTLRTGIMPKGAAINLTSGWDLGELYCDIYHITVSYYGLDIDVRNVLISSTLCPVASQNP